MAVTYRINSGELRTLLTGPSGPVYRDIQRRGNAVLSAARRGAPADTGRLRGSLTMDMSTGADGPVARVGSNLEYAIYVHEGTGVYAGRGPIRPKRGQYLRWPATNNSGAGSRRYSSGRTARYVFAKQVRGVKGRPFLKTALDAARG